MAVVWLHSSACGLEEQCLVSKDLYLSRSLKSSQPPGKPRKAMEFDVGWGIVTEIRKGDVREKSGKLLLASCYSHKINITRVLFSKVDIHKLDLQYCHRSEVKSVNICFHIHS